ncbi:MAG: LCP family protein [Olegusella sp.]|nr:LCP family protein [Olegusella sp.]
MRRSKGRSTAAGDSSERLRGRRVELPRRAVGRHAGRSDAGREGQANGSLRHEYQSSDFRLDPCLPSQYASSSLGSSSFKNSARSGRPKARRSASDRLGSGQDSTSEYSHSNAARRYGSKRQGMKKHHVLRIVLITLASVAAACGVAVAAYIWHINNEISSGVDDDLRSTLTETSDQEPFYMLLLGIDKDEERADSSAYGQDSSAYRTDTIILARVDPTNKKVTLISIPRDLMIDMGSNGYQKINAAYSIGGASYTTQVVSELAGVSISHYAEIDMDGFGAVVDEIGGVTVDLPVAVSDPDYTGLELAAGEQTLDGTTAALLGRCRHGYDDYDSGGDFYREANQRMLIGAVIDKVMGSDAVTIASTISTLAGYVTTDMNVSDITSLATQFQGIDVDSDIYSGQCPTTSKYIDNTWYEICDTDAWKEIMERVDAGEAPYVDASQDATAGVASSVGISTNSSNASSSDETSTDAVYTGNVSVLNASGVQGKASNAANELSSAGFTASAGNASSKTETTAVYYNGDGKQKAEGVAKTLGLSVTPIENDGTYNTTVDVIVVLGSDYSS